VLFNSQKVLYNTLETIFTPQESTKRIKRATLGSESPPTGESYTCLLGKGCEKHLGGAFLLCAASFAGNVGRIGMMVSGYSLHSFQIPLCLSQVQLQPLRA